jgi:hypothetical protein
LLVPPKSIPMLKCLPDFASILSPGDIKDASTSEIVENEPFAFIAMDWLDRDEIEKRKQAPNRIWVNSFIVMSFK